MGVALTAVLLGAAVPAQAAATPPRKPTQVSPASVAPLGNPAIEESCGLDATLVLDASGSVESSHAVGSVRNAARAFVLALKDTKSTARITQFASLTEQLAPNTNVDAAAVAPGGALSAAIDRYYNPKPPRPSDVTIYKYNRGDWSSPGSYSVNNSGTQYTNWQAGMRQGANEGTPPELVIFVTDGDPTAFDLDRPTDPHHGNGKNVAMSTNNGSPAEQTMDRAIEEANRAKRNGSRVLVVGVGPSVTNPGSASVRRMEKLSGPQVITDRDLATIKSINQIDVALVRDFDNLARFLRQVVSELCTPSMTIRKLAQTPQSASFDPASSWDMTVTPTVPGGFQWVLPDRAPAVSKTEATDGQGYAQFQWEPTNSQASSDARVQESLRAGFVAGRPGSDNDWTCERRNPDNANVISVDGDFQDPANPDFDMIVGARDIVTCTVFNSYDYKPDIKIVKKPVGTVTIDGKDTVRANAAGWNLDYEFTVTNPGNTPLSGVNVTDGKCDANPTLVSGDDGDVLLQPSETWLFRCPKFVQHATTTDPNLKLDNTARVTGTDPRGTLVADTDTSTIWLRTPEIALTKTPSAQRVPAGGPVVYSYRLSNVGNDPVTVAALDGLVDDKCSPLSGPTGPGSASGVLGLGVTWTYTCQTNIYEPTLNTATASGKWSGWTATGQNNGPVTKRAQAIVDVVIPAYLTIVKEASPANGTSFDYTAAGARVHPSDESFSLNPGAPGGQTSRTIVVEPARAGSTYTVTEGALPQGWTFAGLTCTSTGAPPTTSARTASVVLRPGDQASCTYSNQKLGSLTVRKVTQPSSASQRFSFTASGDVTDSFSLSGGEDKVFPQLAAGTTVTLTEQQVDGWRLGTLACSDPAAVIDRDQAKATVTVPQGQDVVCTFSNQQIPKASLTVVKQASPATGSFDFEVSQGATSVDAFTLSPTTNNPSRSRTITLSPGDGPATDYRVTEQIPATWDISSIECTVTAANGTITQVSGNPATGVVDVPLSPGDAGTCSYLNERQARLTILKHTAVAPGDTGRDTPFTFSSTDGPFTLRDADLTGDKQVISGIPAGTTVSVQEAVSGPDWPGVDWSLTAIACSASANKPVVDLGTGEMTLELAAAEDVTCAFTNTKRPPAGATLTVSKLADPATGSFPFTVSGTGLVDLGRPGQADFTLSPPNNVSRVFNVKPNAGGNEYTISEGVTPGWDLTALTCQVNGGPVVEAVDGSVTITIQPGDSASCSAVNVERGSLTVTKQTNPAGASEDFEFTANQQSFTLRDGQSWRAGDLPAGTQITLTEASEDYWALQKITCSNGAVPDLAQREVTVTVGSGQDVSCVFTNAEVPPAYIGVFKVVDPEVGTAFPFELSSSTGSQQFSLQPPATPMEIREVRPPLAGEDYTVEERVPAGWTFAEYVCLVWDDSGNQTVVTGTGAASVTQTLKPGYLLDCGFANVRNAQLTVLKSARDAGQQLFDFTATALTPGSFTLGDAGSRTFSGLAFPATVSVTEVVPNRWTLDSIACGGRNTVVDSVDPTTGRAAVTLDGAADATCTYVNVPTIYNPQMELAKRPDLREVLPNGIVRYAYELKNVGDEELELPGGVSRADVVSDDKCSPVQYVGGDDGDNVLAVNEIWRYGCTSAPLGADTVNTATATMVTPAPNPRPLTVTAIATVSVRNPDIRVVKSVDQSLVYTGTDVTYRYLVTNPGAVGLADVKVTDDKCDPVSGPDPGWDLNNNGLLDPLVEQQSWQCLMPIVADTVNEATAVGTPTIPGNPDQVGPPVTDTDTREVKVIDPEVTLTKTASAPGGQTQGDTLMVTSGTRVTFTYEVKNTGDTPLDLGGGVSDDKCSPVRYVSGDTNNDQLIQVDETWVYQCSSVPLGNTGVVRNVATVTATEPRLGRQLVREAPAQIRALESGITVTKTVDQPVISAGTRVTYTYQVVNSGRSVLHDVSLKDDRCAPVTYVGGDDNQDSRLDLTEVWRFECSVVLTDPTVNIVEVRALDPGDTVVKDKATARVQVLHKDLHPRIAVKKTPSAALVQPGTPVTYTYEVTNVGDMPLAEVKDHVHDDKCKPVTYVEGDIDDNGLLTGVDTGENYPEEVWVFTCTTPISVATVNTATVTGSPWNNGRVVGPPVSATTTAHVDVTNEPPTPTRPRVPLIVTTPPEPRTYPPGGWMTIIKKVKAKKARLKYQFRCAPIPTSAAGEVRLCRFKRTKDGGVKVKVIGYQKVRITVVITAIPKPKYRDQYRRNTWRETWILRAR